APLVKEVIAHRDAQAAERDVAGELWHEHDLVFAQANGLPVSSRTDWGEWYTLLSRAGVRDARLHYAARERESTWMYHLDRSVSGPGRDSNPRPRDYAQRASMRLLARSNGSGRCRRGWFGCFGCCTPLLYPAQAGAACRVRVRRRQRRTMGSEAAF